MTRLRAWVAQTERAELFVLLAISLPVLFRPAVGAALLFLVASLWALRWIVRGYPVCKTPLDWPIRLLCAMLVVSLLVTPVMDLTFPRVEAVILGVFIYYAVAGRSRGTRDLPIAAACFVLLGVALAGVGLLGAQWLSKYPALDAVLRRLPGLLQGLPGAEQGIHPNEIAGSLLWVIPIQVALLAYWLAHRGRAWRGKLVGALLAGSLALTLGTLVLTQSRGAWAGLVAAILVMCLMVGRRGIPVAGGMVCLGVFALASLGSSRLMEILFPEPQGATLGSLHLSFRLEIWRTALAGIADFPFTGMGLGAFRKVAPLLYPMHIDPGYAFGHAHNHLLHTAVELGIPGLIAYLSIWLIAGWMVASAWRRSAGWQRALAVGAGGALAAYFVYGMTDTVALGAKPGIVFWYLLGLIAAIWGNSRRQFAHHSSLYDRSSLESLA